MEYILIFNNTHSALKCEQILSDKAISFAILPAPTYITNSCGIAIAISCDDINEIYRLIYENEVVVKDIYDNINHTTIDISKIDFNK